MDRSRVTTEAELEDLLGVPGARDVAKVRIRLHPRDRDWLAASPFCLVATSDAAGRCDVSPKGDPPGFVHVIDDRTIAIPERPGNRRMDGFRNLLQNPHVGLIFVVPGRPQTLRINGRAYLVRDAPYFDALTVAGHRPKLATVVEIEEIFLHCGKAFLRSSLWEPERWAPGALPSHAAIAKEVEGLQESLEALEQHYGPAYADRLYLETAPRKDR